MSRDEAKLPDVGDDGTFRRSSIQKEPSKKQSIHCAARLISTPCYAIQVSSTESFNPSPSIHQILDKQSFILPVSLRGNPASVMVTIRHTVSIRVQEMMVLLEVIFIITIPRSRTRRHGSQSLHRYACWGSFRVIQCRWWRGYPSRRCGIVTSSLSLSSQPTFAVVHVTLV